MASVTFKRELSEEFLSDVLITAFDGSYGGSWNWFEPAPLAGQSWLTVKNESGHTSIDNPWMSVRIRLQEDYHTGNVLFDSTEGFLIDHDSIAQGISRIINDDYIGIWRPALHNERLLIDQGRFSREHRGVGKDLEVETGETARAYKELLLLAVEDEDAGNIDADVADAIVQVATFGKVIFG